MSRRNLGRGPPPTWPTYQVFRLVVLFAVMIISVSFNGGLVYLKLFFLSYSNTLLNSYAGWTGFPFVGAVQ
jgi:hypothetical protein